MKCALQKGEYIWNKMDREQQQCVLKFCIQEYEKELKRQVDATECETEKVMIGLCLIALTQMGYAEDECYKLLTRMRRIKLDLNKIHTETRLNEYLEKHIPDMNAYENICKLCED